ncbi:MAG: multiheme c-type cytochrome [Thermodesulfobacteriota bacterium]
MFRNIKTPLIILFVMIPALGFAADMGSYSYKDFKKPRNCQMCHKEIAQEWQQSLMSQSFTHKWDQVEYFKLALPHSQELEKVAGIKGDCIACHAPLAFLSGDIPPKKAAEDTRANEGVSCEICHNITGTTESSPFNFSYKISPDNVKIGPRKDAESPFHESEYSEFLQSPELCATCHDEQSPYGAWVKSTYREFKAGPYAKEGITCQDCHMYRFQGKSAMGGKERDDVAHHVFHGSHFESKLGGSLDLALYSDTMEVKPGDKVKVRAELLNGKAGHSVPTGSTEERMVWLQVLAIDSNGKIYILRVEPKGFEGEEYTIADSEAIAYQAMGEIMKVKNHKGLRRDGIIADGSRIFRRPFFDPKGRMTVCQWYTADNTKVDYRVGPMETKIENYIWQVPENIAPGPITIKADLFYSLVPSSVGEFLDLPEDEYKAMLVNSTELLLRR